MCVCCKCSFGRAWTAGTVLDDTPKTALNSADTGRKSVSVCMLNDFVRCASVRAAKLFNEHIASMCELNHCWLNSYIDWKNTFFVSRFTEFFRTSLHIVHNGPAKVYAFINTKFSSMSSLSIFCFVDSFACVRTANPFNPINAVSLFNEIATVTGVARSWHTVTRLYHLRWWCWAMVMIHVRLPHRRKESAEYCFWTDRSRFYSIIVYRLYTWWGEHRLVTSLSISLLLTHYLYCWLLLSTLWLNWFYREMLRW